MARPAAAGSDGGPATPAFDWPTLVANKDREIERLNGIYRGLIEGAGARLYDARATIAGPHAVSVAGRTVTARHILVATGGEPSLPDLPGIEHAIRSDDVFYLERLPERPSGSSWSGAAISRSSWRGCSPASGSK